MTFTPLRVLAASAMILVGGTAVAGCAKGIDTDASGSIAVVEKFLVHLEAGEATKAAALTDLVFADEFIDDDFYAASAALPTDAHIVETTGWDDVGVTATVEYVLADASEPESLEISVDEKDGEFTITRLWRDLNLDIGPYPAQGVVRVNDTLEYSLAESNELSLLPALYNIEYVDTTGLLRLGEDNNTSLTVESPNLDVLTIVPGLMPDVDPAIRAEVERLQATCVAEGLTGPSCPTELVEAATASPGAAAEETEWFRQNGPDLWMKGKGYEATMAFQLRNEQLPKGLIVTYTGIVTRDASGAVVFTR